MTEAETIPCRSNSYPVTFRGCCYHGKEDQHFVRVTKQLEVLC